MLKKSKLIYLNILLPLMFIVAVSVAGRRGAALQENHPPVVKIVSPKNNTAFDWDAQVNYEISVADKEDGDSKFDEINAKEILLEVRYIADKARLPGAISKAAQNDAPGLAVMRTSNCFNCHSFNKKEIGPSFSEIGAKYQATPANTDLLVKHIREGSSGIWGKETMPTHPELSAEETKSTVQWILKSAKDKDVNYYTGATGAFHTKLTATGKKGVYLITASYLDHGLKDSPVKHLKSQDVVVLNAR
jgi:cytochrome c